jgi:hypothetical protein
MMKASTIAAALGLAASPAFGACSEDTINMATSDGEILITVSGQLYRVLPDYAFYSKGLAARPDDPHLRGYAGVVRRRRAPNDLRRHQQGQEQRARLGIQEVIVQSIERGLLCPVITPPASHPNSGAFVVYP